MGRVKTNLTLLTLAAFGERWGLHVCVFVLSDCRDYSALGVFFFIFIEWLCFVLFIFSVGYSCFSG